jgi:hypothetical protein
MEKPSPFRYRSLEKTGRHPLVSGCSQWITQSVSTRYVTTSARGA